MYKYIITFLLVITSQLSIAKSFTTIDGKCPFCLPSIIERQTVVYGENALTMLNYAPITDGHILVIPRRKVNRFEDLTDLEMKAILHHVQLSVKAFKDFYKVDDYIVLQKNGIAAGQSVEHIHFHLIPIKDENMQLPYLKSALNLTARPKLEPEELAAQKNALKEYFDNILKESTIEL